MPLRSSTPSPGILILEVNRPHVRNALDWETIEVFASQINRAHGNPALRVLIITGAGSAFIAGGDLRALRNHITQSDGERLAHLMSTALNRLSELRCSTIAAINGPARGGGTEIALACDLRVMATNADFGFVHINLGLTPGWGAGQRLLHLVGYSRSYDWLTTGRILSAQEAYDYGVVNRLAEKGKALAVSLALAEELAKKPAAAMQAVKRILRGGMLFPPSMAASAEMAAFPPLWASDDHIQAMDHFFKGKSE